jgi:hypothetical protein
LKVAGSAESVAVRLSWVRLKELTSSIGSIVVVSRRLKVMGAASAILEMLNTARASNVLTHIPLPHNFRAGSAQRSIGLAAAPFGSNALHIKSFRP